jgi:hypothetical protein
MGYSDIVRQISGMRVPSKLPLVLGVGQAVRCVRFGVGMTRGGLMARGNGSRHVKSDGRVGFAKQDIRAG